MDMYATRLKINGNIIILVYTPCPLYFCLEVCQMLTEFQNSFTDGLSSKFLAKQH